MSEELKPTDDQCDRLVSLTMEKLAAKGCDQYGDMTCTDLNPNIMEHHALRRSIVRVAYGAGEAEAIAAWSRRAQPEPAAPAIPAGWVPLTLEWEPGYPEDVAFGPQRMMDRLKKWLDKYFANVVAERNAAPSVAPEPPTREALAEIVRSHLTSTYHCTRVWEAWHVGTMTEDDFEPASESDMAEDIADAILAAHPPRAPLTDAEIAECAAGCLTPKALLAISTHLLRNFTRAIEAAHGISAAAIGATT